jgi:hypothetical protein
MVHYAFDVTYRIVGRTGQIGEVSVPSGLHALLPGTLAAEVGESHPSLLPPAALTPAPARAQQSSGSTEIAAAAPRPTSGVLFTEGAQAFWKDRIGQRDGVLRPRLTGRVPVNDGLDGGGWGIGHLMEIRFDSTADGVTASEDETSLDSVLEQGIVAVSPVRDVVAAGGRTTVAPMTGKLGLRSVLDRALTAAGVTGVTAEALSEALEQLDRRWSPADVTSTMDARRLWRGVDVLVDSVRGPQVVTVRLIPRDDAPLTSLAPSSVEIPDHRDAGVFEAWWFDYDQKNETNRNRTNVLAGGGTFAVGVGLLPNSPHFTAGVTGRVTGGGASAVAKASVTYTNRSDVAGFRGSGLGVLRCTGPAG